MFFLYPHHDLARLSELLAVMLSRHKRTHVLTPDTVLVPNHALGRWLQLKIAADQGIAANIEMPLTARFIWQTIPRLLPDAPDSTDYERGRMRWHLFALLTDIAESVPVVATYLEGGEPDIQRLQLADRLADVFDQYLIYRPRLLAAWEQGQEDDSTPAAWQAVVWRALVKRLGDEHRARLLDLACKRLSQPPQPLDHSDALPESIWCFGLGHLPPDYLRFLYALGQRIDVHFLLQNPSDAYWGDIQKARIDLDLPEDPALQHGENDIEHQQPLLAANGLPLRNLLRLLYSEQLTGILTPELGSAMEADPPAGDSLLQRVQRDVIGMRVSQQAALIEGDSSVQVHACHGPLREVQVLHDQLLDLLSADDSLQPRDIVVMLPDIGRYAAAVRSVFGGAAADRRIPWSLADNTRIASHPLIQSFRGLLALPHSRWTASEILELASIPAVMRRHGLDDAALERIAHWTQSAGVRWGRDRRTREQFGAGSYDENSWQFGLDRLLLGIAQSDDSVVTAGVAPWSDLEGAETQALGRFWLLWRRLGQWCDTAAETLNMAQWQDQLARLLDDLYRPDPADDSEQLALREISQALDTLEQAGRCLGQEALDWPAVRETLLQALDQPASRQPWLSGGVTFCGMEPLRGVPFRVVCLLGMDDGVFPRNDRNPGFNLLHRHGQQGDFDRHHDDRLIFLQAILAARDVFYASYTGQDPASGESLPPSTLIAEWLEFLRRHYLPDDTPPNALLTRHPMPPFSRHYFSEAGDNARLFTFAAEWQPAASQDVAADRARIPAPPFVGKHVLPEVETSEVTLADLRRFFDHPPRWFFRQHMRLALDPAEAVLRDEEPLIPDNLERYQLRARLLNSVQAGDTPSLPERPEPTLAASGMLPPPPLGQQWYAEQIPALSPLIDIWQGWLADGQSDRQSDRQDIDLEINETRLSGQIHAAFEGGLRSLRPGKQRMQYRFRVWLDYLVWLAMGNQGDLQLAGIGDKGKLEYWSGSCTPDAAATHLEHLLALYRLGQQRPLPVTPGLAEYFLESTAGGNNEAEALALVNEELFSETSPAREATDPWFRPLLIEGALPEDDWPTLVKHSYGPAFTALQPGELPT